MNIQARHSKFRLVLAAVFCILLIADSSWSAPAQGADQYKDWPADSIEAPKLVGTVSVKVPNDNRIGGPNGMTVNLPKDVKVLNQTPQLVTPHGAKIAIVFLEKMFEPTPAALKRTTRPEERIVASRPWLGTITEEKQDGNNTKMYSLHSSAGTLLVFATWPQKVAEAGREADIVARLIIHTVKPDQTAKKVYLEEENAPVPAKNEIVMTKGMKITATTKTGTITISDAGGLRRCYTWEGATRCVVMNPREERWYGSLGIVCPGSGEHWEEHHGITRGVLEEGQRHFKTQGEAMKWIKGMTYTSCVYSDSGLVVCYSKVLDRKQLNVDVWQIFVKGKKPVKLPGSTNKLIKVTGR